MSPTSFPPDEGRLGEKVALPPEELLHQVQSDAARSAGIAPVELLPAGAVGATMFDLPGSEDNTVTVLLPQENIQKAPSQALVRIHSRGDGRCYLGIVTAGPFAEPDALRGDSHLLVTVNARGGLYLPPYHGRVQVAILGEELAGGTLVPPRLRPLPNSPVFVLDGAEAARVLRVDGDLRLGVVVGHGTVPVHLPSQRKDVLPRHMAILGTTGGGKSTTVARLVQQAQAAGWAVILLDVEGEYTHLHEPADHPRILQALAERGLAPAGLPPGCTFLYHLVGRQTANPGHPNRRAFSLQFDRLSPYAVAEILELSDAQEQRFFEAYDVAKEVLRDLGIFPQQNVDEETRTRQERFALELDEFSRGYPCLTLGLLLDVVSACQHYADRQMREGRWRANRAATESAGHAEETEDLGAFRPSSPVLNSAEGLAKLKKRIHAHNISGNVISWRALLGRLNRLNRLKVFDHPRIQPLKYRDLIQPGTVSLIDLSDSGASELNNIVIADLLRGVQLAQDRAYQEYERAKKEQGTVNSLPRVLLIIEEAHEFLSTERARKMDTLLEQVARVAKRGRKRWLGLVFVTQLPQHLPPAFFGLVNSYILHKIADPQVIQLLQHSVGGVDQGLWRRLAGLAPGQALVAFPHWPRALLVSIDPAPGKLRLVD